METELPNSWTTCDRIIATQNPTDCLPQPQLERVFDYLTPSVAVPLRLAVRLIYLSAPPRVQQLLF